MQLGSRIPGVSVLLTSVRTLSPRHKCYLPGCLGFPDSSVDKESACNAGDPSSIPRSGRSPGEGKGSILALFWQYSTHCSILAWRIPGLYSPWGCKELDTTE